MKIKRSQPSIKVAVRVRPLLSTFEDEAAWNIQPSTNSIYSLNRQSPNDKTPKKRYVEVFSNYRYNFDHVFGNNTSTKDIYQTCCLQMIDGFLEGQNSTIFMYGQTTSGKTYTMLGDGNYQGLITFSLKDIFHKFSQRYSTKNYKIAISYLEIYNEQINDLLNPGSVNLKIIEDTVQGLKYCEAGSFQQAEELLLSGEEQRIYKQKSIHDHSSRSHTIFQIRIIDIKHKKNLCSLNLVDLAGSQRLTDEDRINDSTEETGYINKSLFQVSQMQKVVKLQFRQHIPFRDSKLTRLLSNSLIGRSNTMIICTVSPAAMNFYQTLSTLRFATNAKKMERQLTQLEDSFDKQNRQKDLQSSKQIQSIKEQVWRLKKILKQYQKREEQLKHKIEQLTNNINLTTSQISKDSQKTSINEKQFLSKLKEQIEEKMPSLPHQWIKKSSDLCLQYSKNIDLLQYKYKVALFNIAEVECSDAFTECRSNQSQFSDADIIKKIQTKCVFDGLAVSGLLNVDCDVQVCPKELELALRDAKKVLAEKFFQLRKFLSVKHETKLQQILQKQFDQKMQIIQQAYKNVCRARGLL